jgi:alpha-tubulin suppressor-like RCC1 family protein
MSQIMEKFDVFKELNDEFKQRVKILYVFEDYWGKGYNVLIVTKDDKTYAFGRNSYNQLGFGHNKVVNEIQIVEELCDQQIIDFAGWRHCIARNSSGKVYCWGYNEMGLLGNGSQDNIYHKPILNQYLNNEFVVDISCGARHSLVLTNYGEVYAWGRNWDGQIGNGCNDDQLIPIKVKGFNNERVVMISCGRFHSMALTECGHVYSWGDNECGQLGIRKKVETPNSPIIIEIKRNNKINHTFKKISCGHSHSLLLSEEGVIYAFGNNECGQVGVGNNSKVKSPQKIRHKNKFIDIKCHFSNNISIALSESNVFYIWGKCKEENIYYPRDVKSESFDDIFAEYLKITDRALDMEKLLKAEMKCGNGRYSEEFEEKNLIATGSYGIVCKAMYKKNNELFAIKKIPIEKRFKEKALKEIEILPKLKSEFIVRLESAWIEDNYINVADFKLSENSSIKPSPEILKAEKTLLLHIQMELCSKTLKDLINQLNQELNQKPEEVMTPLGYYISSELFIEILESVDYLHKQKVIHRDLKPTNILITDGENGRFVKIADFGLATIHEFEGQSHTKYSGTPKYRAPEVCSKNKYDLKADIYSLGFILQDLFNFDVNE